MVLLAVAVSGAHLPAPVSAVVPSYKLIVSVNPGSSAGSVALTPAGGTYVANTTVSFKATANTGWYFVAWALNYSDTDPVWGNKYSGYYSNQNPASLKMNSTYVLTAYFQQQNQWIRYSGNPILTATPGTWDQDYVWNPQVFQYPNGTFGMVYLGCCNTASGNNAIGLATSSDGVNWRKYSGGPILDAGTGTWDHDQMRTGTVLYDSSESKYLMYYSARNSTGYFHIGLATSDDSIHWDKYGSNPLLLGQALTVVKHGGVYMMWYFMFNTVSFGSIMLATSTDTTTWTVQNGGGPVFKPDSWGFPGNGANPNAWDFDFFYRPSVVYDPFADDFKMTYSAVDVSGEDGTGGALSRIGLAVSSDGITWTKYPGNPIIAPIPGGWDNGEWVENAGLFWLNGTLRVYYSGITSSSASCIDLQWPGCNHWTAYSIGLLYAQEVPLVTGWNLVSLPVVPASSDIKSILRPLLSANEVTAVWSYSVVSKSWSFYKPTSTPTGTLLTMQDGVGYWIYMTKPDTLIVGGYVIAPASLPPTYTLYNGWNLIGFKPQPNIENETVTQYLSSIVGLYDVNNVWVYDSIGGNWERAGGGTWLLPGQAMWIFITAPSGTTLKP